MSGEQEGESYELMAIVESDANGGGVAGGAVLNALAEAVMARDDEESRRQYARIVSELGEMAAVDAAAVVGAFNLVARVADTTGLPLEDYKVEATAEVRANLGLDAWQSHA